MDPGVYRQGLGSFIPRPPQQQHYYPRKPPPPPPIPISHSRDDPESDAPNRIAHTLTACCRCRQRKTRCDPALPRCIPCSRSGTVCEYFDTTKRKKISRMYVVKLQETVRRLEAELHQYTNDEHDDEKNIDELVGPGGLVRLDESDATPRYLGPSSGIAMTRLLMDVAKRYTKSTQVAQIYPDVKRRFERYSRMHSIISRSGSVGGRKKSYPMMSEHPAVNLPSRQMAERLVEVYNQRAQVFYPTLHEKMFADDLDAVLKGDNDPYKRFVVSMVLAISLQKLDTQYAGLADSYYLAAMQYFEDIVRPKDLKTLQCLVLISQYSLLTPTRTAVYYVVGMATKICQQLGLGEEKTIGLGITDPQTLDLRRRLSWIITTHELGLAHIMGRPNGFAKGDDFMDVKFFETAEDHNITPEGIIPGPVSEKKVVAIHFCKMRLLQAEIRRTLYEKKRPEPTCDDHPWFAKMESKLEEWRDASPVSPEWCKPWFTGRYHAMIVFLYRPSPQVPKPSSSAAVKCFDGAHYIINLSSQQVKKAAVDITWIFLLTLYMSINALLWTLSYSKVREEHSREEVEDLISTALEIIDQCSERWPGTMSASQLYTVFAKACMESYEVKKEAETPHRFTDMFNIPLRLDSGSPDSETSATGPGSTGVSTHQHQPPQAALFNTSVFGYKFDSTEGLPMDYSLDAGPGPFRHPTFRSNSIFLTPATDSNGRRFSSQYAPDSTNSGTGHAVEHSENLPSQRTDMSYSHISPPIHNNEFFSTHTTPQTIMAPSNTLPTPPESLPPPSTGPGNASLSPSFTTVGLRTASPTPTPILRHASPGPMSMHSTPVLPPREKFEHVDYSQTPQQTNPQPNMQPPRSNVFTIPPLPQRDNRQARGAPTTVTDWHNPPPPFIPAHAFASAGMNTDYWGTDAAPNPFLGLGLSGNESYSVGPPRGMPGPGSMGGHRHGPGMAAGGFSGGGMVGAHGVLGSPFHGGIGPGFGNQWSYLHERQGSLSQEQQVELMQVLEDEGMEDIDAILSMGMGVGMPGDASAGGSNGGAPVGSGVGWN